MTRLHFRHHALHHNGITVLVCAVWCWCAFAIPLWCILDCHVGHKTHTQQYVCDHLTDQQPHNPPFRYHTLLELQIVMLTAGIVVCFHAIRTKLIPISPTARSWDALLATPPPKHAVFR